ncbi:MAG: glycosyltransferase family 4 protein [Leptospiraceae bacterium]|nr:glycosyltransferase family 4 protein [Leptospiraceae bacterium]MCP5511567.1 glycosyltransferase family 4 protein [Leptospiraceae bacterium]
MKKNRILMVTTIFSEEAFGGAERLSLDYATKLSDEIDLTILTTTSLSYLTWEPVLNPGEEKKENMNILRFDVKKKRNLRSFNRYYTSLLKKKEVRESDFQKFIELQGPFVPELIEYIKNHHSEYDVILFIGYLYYPIVLGLPFCKNKSVCVLTLHDEPPAYFPIYKELFTDEIFYSFNTPEELDLFEKIFHFTPEKYRIIGTAVEIPDEYLIPYEPKPFPYLLYVGRVDEGKGVYRLIEFFRKWKKQFPSDFKLIIAGGGERIESDEEIESLGFISEKDKFSWMSSAFVLVNPSPMESFSITIMESWLMGVPVLVNSESDTMRNHCIRSNGGLYYQSQESFFRTMEFMISNKQKRKKMGENGKRYVTSNYSSSRIKKLLLDLIDEMAGENRV